MPATVLVPPIPSDPGLPGARGLFTGEGEATLGAFLAERGWALEEARPVQATYRPGRSCVVRYRVQATGPGGRRGLSMCVETRARRPRDHAPLPGSEGLLGIPDPVGRVDGLLVWPFPYDPSLPNLPEAASGEAVRTGLAELGEGPAAVSVQALRYRPRRRAVFRYRVLRHRRTGRRWETSFGKVLPRSKAGRVAAAARVIRGGPSGVALALPARALGAQTFLFDPLPGRSLRDLLVGGGALPSPERVAALPDAVAAEIDDVGGIAGVAREPLEVATSASVLLERLVPWCAGDIRRVLDAVAGGASHDRVPPRPVHGDLYDAQVFVERDFSLGLIDLDDLGPGDPAADAANFCAHLLALALSVPAAAPRLVAYRTLVREAFLERLGIPTSALAWREALAMLLLATGPFRVLDPAWPREIGRRVRLAVRLLEVG